MKKILVALVAAMAMAVPAAWAAPGHSNGQPAHGCDQAAGTEGGNYHSTCDGSPSQNGNGNGQATGKPCAGCVGAADNKNPPGQAPDGSDHNNGYECDGNNGVGKSNPAHTGCVTEPYSGAVIPVQNDKHSDGSNGNGPKNPRPARFEVQNHGSGPTGGVIVLAGLGVLMVFAASRTVRRFARR